MSGAQIALLLAQATPTAVSQGLAWWVRITNDRRVRELQDGTPEKEAAIVAVLAELGGQSAALQAVIDAKP